MKTASILKSIDEFASSLDDFLSDLEDEISELEDKQSELSSKARQTKIDNLTEISNLAELVRDAMEECKGALEQ